MPPKVKDVQQIVVTLPPLMQSRKKSKLRGSKYDAYL